MDLAAALADDLDAAFPTLVDAYGRDVYSLALRLHGHGRPDAEDAAQDAFVRAYQALRTYEPKRIADLDLRPWVLTIALNVVRNRNRSRARRPTAALADSPTPDDTTTATDRRLALATALAALPLPARQAVVLRHVIGCSTDETATILQRPTGTVKAQVARGLATLRTLLEDDR